MSGIKLNKGEVIIAELKNVKQLGSNLPFGASASIEAWIIITNKRIIFPYYFFGFPSKRFCLSQYFSKSDSKKNKSFFRTYPPIEKYWAEKGKFHIAFEPLAGEVHAIFLIDNAESICKKIKTGKKKK